MRLNDFAGEMFLACMRYNSDFVYTLLGHEFL